MSLYHLLHHDNKGVRRFDAGGVTETTVSDWAAPVVSGVIQRGLEIAGTAPAVYGGATVAGASDLQNKAFSGIEGLTAPNTSQANAGTNLQDVYKSAMTQPAYTGTTFTSNTTGINNQFDQNALNSYMNPYLSTILNPQLAEAKRNASIEQAKNQAQMIKTGAFGGGGGNYLNAETQRNLGTKLADITGKGYGDAYTAALGQYNADQNRLLDALKETEKSKQYGATSGLDYLKLAGTTAQNQGTFGNEEQRLGLAANRQEADLGKEQRDIIQQGLKSDYEIWKEQRDAPKTNLDWFQKLISQYPMTTTNVYGQVPNAAASTIGGVLTGATAYDLLAGKKKPG